MKGTTNSMGLADGAVTRAKLAQDALYSPIITAPDNEWFALQPAHCGCIIRPNYNSPRIQVNQNTALPVGFEVGVTLAATAKSSYPVVFGTKTSVSVLYYGTYAGEHVVNVASDGFAVLKLFARSGGVDYWQFIGSVG